MVTVLVVPIVVVMNVVLTVLKEVLVLLEVAVTVWVGAIVEVVTRGGLSDFRVGALIDASANVFAGVKIAKCVMPAPLEGFGC